MLDLEAVALAAILHDVVGLLHEDGTKGIDRGLEERGYLAAALTPGSRLPESLVVRAARGVVVSSDGEGKDPAAPLESVFNAIRLGGRKLPDRRFHRPVEYGGDDVRSYLPLAPGVGGGWDRERLKKALAEKLVEIEGPLRADVVMNLLEHYGSNLRSGMGDVSLFDTARATAAVAVCIAGYFNDSGKEPDPDELERADARGYLFVRGDLSGVQDFIYTITSRGALRMLRARSFLQGGRLS